MPSKVKDMNLADQGAMQIEYAEMNMPALMKVRERFQKEQPLKGYRIGMALHLTKETAGLVRTLKAGGAEVAIASCNPLSTQDDVAAALAKEEGVLVFGYKGETNEEYYEYLKDVIDFSPNVTIDDGADLIFLLHKEYPDKMKNVLAGTEETTTGIIRLRAMEKDNALKYPVFAVNDNQTKHLFDNFYGTGQSALDGILRATNVLFAGKVFVVSGYGDCGKGVAARAQGMGSNVVVTEVDPVRALQAHADGYRVMEMEKAAAIGDIFLTVTGDKHVIRTEHVEKMKHGAIIANAGHFDLEIDVKGIDAMATNKRRVRWQLDEYTLSNGRKVFLCAEGRLVNLGAAEGHPSEVMDLSFCGQALAAEYAVKHQEGLEAKMHVLPKEIDDGIAALKLEAMGVSKDSLTAEQKKYLDSWEEGT